MNLNFQKGEEEEGDLSTGRSALSHCVQAPTVCSTKWPSVSGQVGNFRQRSLCQTRICGSLLIVSSLRRHLFPRLPSRGTGSFWGLPCDLAAGPAPRGAPLMLVE